MNSSKLPKRQYTDEFKVEAIWLADSVGDHEAARRLGIPVATLGNWSRRRRPAGLTLPQESGAVVPTRHPVSKLEAGDSRLYKELAEAQRVGNLLLNELRLLHRSCSLTALRGLAPSQPTPVMRCSEIPSPTFEQNWNEDSAISEIPHQTLDPRTINNLLHSAMAGWDAAMGMGYVYPRWARQGIVVGLLGFACLSSGCLFNGGGANSVSQNSPPPSSSDNAAPRIPDNKEEAEHSSARIFLSGHSLMDNPLADYIADIAAKKGDDYDFQYNQQIVLGSPIRYRTKGPDWTANGWPGYGLGKNRRGENMNVVAELAHPQTLGAGERYDVLVLTENHNILQNIQWEDTVGFTRHYVDRFITGNPEGRSFLYQSWLDINKSSPAAWIDHEKKALGAWECIASKVNLSLAEDSRSDRMKVLPAGAALTDLVERVLAGEVTGLTGSTEDKMNALFDDNVHLTNLGIYYVALVTYSAIYAKSPQSVAPPPDIDESIAASLQQIAWNYTRAYYASLRDKTMDECRVHVSERVCPSYWNLKQRPDAIASCQAEFGDENPNAIFKWPDPNHVRHPAP